MNPNSGYAISISGVKDLGGNQMAGTVTYSFTTGDVVDLDVPTVVSTSPAANATGVSRSMTAMIVLSEPIDPATLSGSIQIQEYSSALASTLTITLSADRRTITVTPVGQLKASTAYSLMITGSRLADLAGNTVANISISFTTGTN